MKIAVIDPSLFTLPYDSHLCNGLSETGCSVTLIGRELRQGETIAQKRFIFSPFFYGFSEKISPRLGKLRNAIKAIEHLVDLIGLVLKIRRENFTVVHFQWIPIPTLDRLAIKIIKKKAPVIFTVHDTRPFNENPTSPLQNIGWKKTLDIFDSLIVHTKASRDALVSFGVKESVIRIIPHGLLDFGVVKAGHPENKTILFFGAIKEYKGVDILLRSFAKTNHKGWKLHIVGKCSKPAKYENIIKTNLLEDSVEFENRFFADSELPGIISSASVVIFPYRYIDGSGAFLTSLTYGKPFLATKVGIFAEIAGSNSPALIPPENEIVLAERLQNIMVNPEELAKLKKESSRLRISILSWKDIGIKTLETYKDISNG